MKKSFLLLGLCLFFYTPACEGGVRYRSELAEILADEYAARQMSRNDFPAAARRTAKDRPLFGSYHREMSAPPESEIGFDIGEFYSQLKNLENMDENSRRIKIPKGIFKPAKKKPPPSNPPPQQSPPKDDSYVPDVSVGISADIEIPISGDAGDESDKQTDY